MKGLALGAVLLSLAVGPTPAALAESPAPVPAGGGSVSVGGAGGTITWATAGGTPPSALPGAPGRESRSAAPAPAYLAQVPAVAWDGTGLCFTSRAVAYSSQAAATAVTASFEQTWILGVSRYPPCPAPASSAASGPGPSPALLAARWWQASGAAALPRPQPAIAPGYALAGKPGYLEAGLPVTRMLSADTPLGTLTVWARAWIWVDWGDGGGWSGPYPTSGGPWPGGGITHTWDSVGTVNLEVRATWTASWALDGASGTLTSLQTTGSLRGFEIRQLQSLRDR